MPVRICSLLFFIGNKDGNHMSVFGLEAGANSNSIALYQCWTYAVIDYICHEIECTILH